MPMKELAPFAEPRPQLAFELLNISRTESVGAVELQKLGLEPASLLWTVRDAPQHLQRIRPLSRYFDCTPDGGRPHICPPLAFA